MRDLFMVSVPVLLAAILAAVAAVFLRLGDHGERLARLEAQMTALLQGHWMVGHGPGS